MAAPNLPALYDFEGQFEAAAQAILTAGGVTNYITQAKIQQALISTGISFETGAAIDNLTFLPLAPGQTNPVEQEYFRYTGNLTLRVEVNRDNASAIPTGVATFFNGLRGLIRGLFMRSQWPFQDSNLAYYRVSDIRPNGSFQGVSVERNTDFVQLSFIVTFAIQPTAWPTGFPPT